MQKQINEIKESMRLREDYLSAVELEERGFRLEEHEDGSITIKVPADVLEDPTAARWVSILARLAVMDIAVERLQYKVEAECREVEKELEGQRHGGY